MNKKNITISVIIAMVLCCAILIGKFALPKNSDNLPALSSIALMDEGDINEALSGYYINQLIEVWGEPDVSSSNANEYIWYIDTKSTLVIYTNWQNKVVVCSISPYSGNDTH